MLVFDYAENTRDKVHTGISFFILFLLLLMVSLSEDKVHYFTCSSSTKLHILKFNKTSHTQIQQNLKNFEE